MKKTIKIIIMALVISSLYTVTAFAYVKKVEIPTADNKDKVVIYEGLPDDDKIANATYGCDVTDVGWQEIGMFKPGNALIPGETKIFNFDSSKLGLQTVDFVFTPDDSFFPQLTGTQKVFVRMSVKSSTSDDEDVTTSLVESAITLEPNTSYIPHLTDMIDGSEYTWTTSNKAIAKVNKKTGQIKAVSAGTATIKCKVDTPYDDTYTLSIDVTVKAPTKSLRSAAVSGSALSISNKTITMSRGDKLTLTPEYDATASTCMFKSSKSSIVQVDGYTGEITAKKSGAAYILCTITSTDYSVRTVRYDIIVQ